MVNKIATTNMSTYSNKKRAAKKPHIEVIGVNKLFVIETEREILALDLVRATEDLVAKPSKSKA